MIERAVLMAADQASDYARQRGMGEAALGQLRADLARLSGLSGTEDPSVVFAVFTDMRGIRARIYRLLEQRLWPRERTDLFLLLGRLNGLMGTAALRLGYPDAAEELIRAGWIYANAIDHQPLMNHLRSSLCAISESAK